MGAMPQNMNKLQDMQQDKLQEQHQAQAARGDVPSQYPDPPAPSNPFRRTEQ
jgi:hypothetical protein